MIRDEDGVLDSEVLYRVVPDRKGNYVPEEGNRISSAAFGGGEKMQPSVDRATLRSDDPENSKWDPTDFIASLVTCQVRAIEAVPKDIDVAPDPIKDHPHLHDNPAHALIKSYPKFKPDEKMMFRKLRKALSRLARWEISPPDAN